MDEKSGLVPYPTEEEAGEILKEEILIEAGHNLADAVEDFIETQVCDSEYVAGKLPALRNALTKFRSVLNA